MPSNRRDRCSFLPATPIPRLFVFLILAIFAGFGCHKDNQSPLPQTPSFIPRLIEYKVSGDRIRLNYIDSNSVFVRGELFNGSFAYQFHRGPGAGIGISVFAADSSATISSWEIYIDNKLYANAFSPGGAYFTIPYP